MASNVGHDSDTCLTCKSGQWIYLSAARRHIPDGTSGTGGEGHYWHTEQYSLESTIADLCKNLQLDLSDPEYAETPARAAEWFQSFSRKPDYDSLPESDKFLSKTFSSKHKGLVWETDLSFVALCPHHLLPYTGTAAIAYIPSSGVVGISKLSRTVEYFTHYPVKQEDATADIADALFFHMRPQPLGCMVVLRAHHTCMGLRGVRQQDHLTGTSAVRGIFDTDTQGCRTEFLRLISNPH